MGPLYASRLGRWALRVAVAAWAGAALWRLSAFGHPLPLSLWLGLLALLLGVLLLGSFYPPAGVHARPLLMGPRDRRQVALTFDDGPDPQGTPAVLAVLARHGARATFFVIGERAARHPELVAALVRAGHQVENHSHRHAWSTPLLPRRKLAAELRAAQQAIAAASGRPPRFLRPPIGVFSPPVVAAAAQVGLRLCGWSCKARDGLAQTSAEAALGRLRAGARPGAILLLHDGAERAGRIPVAAAVLERLLPLLAERGLQAVTLDELLSDDKPQGLTPPAGTGFY